MYPAWRTARRRRPRSERSPPGSRSAPPRWWVEPPSAGMPMVSATASTRVDLPLPYSPTRKVTPTGRSSPCSSTCATAGTESGHTPGSTAASGRRSMRRVAVVTRLLCHCSGGSAGRLAAGLVAAGQPLGEVGDEARHVLGRDPDRPDAEHAVPQRQHDEPGLVVPGDAHGPAVTADVGAVVEGKSPVGDMGYTAYFTDSEGNVVGLWQNA